MSTMGELLLYFLLFVVNSQNFFSKKLLLRGLKIVKIHAYHVLNIGRKKLIFFVGGASKKWNYKTIFKINMCWADFEHVMSYDTIDMLKTIYFFLNHR